jgi:restriction system protein
VLWLSEDTYSDAFGDTDGPTPDKEDAKMTEPKLNEYILPVFKLFADGKEHGSQEIPPHLAETTDLSERDKPRRAQLMINGSVGYLIKALCLEKTDEKVFKITDRGKQLLDSTPESISVKDLMAFKEFESFMSGRVSKAQPEAASPDTLDELPEDQIKKAFEAHKAVLAVDVLEKVKQCSWQFFELLVMDLMVKMGYGDPFDEARLTKGPGDEGIDGVIKEDSLGLGTICLQAKKWENTVGRPEIQKFAGSLESKRARKGVFITTSTFSQEAHDYVGLIEKKIVLIDGRRLAELMITYGVGVSDDETFTIKKIDSDYFDS